MVVVAGHGVRRRGARAAAGCARGDVHHHQQLRLHGVAGAAVQRGVGAAVHDGVRARAGGVAGGPGAVGVVGPHVGAHALRRVHRRQREVRLRHRRLRFRRRAVQRRRCRATGDPGRVHARRQRRARLLRRQPRRRIQPAHAGHPQRHRLQLLLRQVRGDGVHGGAERRVPGRPARGVGVVGGGGGVPERVRGVRVGGVLLQRRLRQPEHLPAVGVLGVLQGGVPARLQLCLRRLHLHLHLRRRRHRLRNHLLPRRSDQREVVRAEPAGRRAAAAERHHGLLRRRRRWPAIQLRNDHRVVVRRRRRLGRRRRSRRLDLSRLARRRRRRTVHAHTRRRNGRAAAAAPLRGGPQLEDSVDLDWMVLVYQLTY